MHSPPHVSPGSLVRIFLLTVAALVAVPLLPADARAQAPWQIPAPSDTVYEVRLGDGSVIYGRIAEVDSERVVLTTVGGGRLEVERSQIREVRPAAGRVVEGEYWNEDPGGTRLFFTATGRSLKEGESYIGTYVVVLPFGALGLTDRITIAGGAPILFGEFEPLYLAPKVQIVRSPTAQVSVGTLAFLFDGETVGIAYGVGTFGSADEALSLGVGFFYAGDEVADEPAFMFGGETRVNRRVKLITENYILPDRVGTILSGGIRVIGDRFSTEVAVFGAAGDGGTGCCLPLLNFSYALGKR